jgi:molecular chaperone HtpG
MMAKKTLEINPHHSVMKQLLQKVKDSVDGKLDEETEELATVLFNMALLNSGFNIEEPSAFTNPLQKLINIGFGLNRDEAVEEIEIDVEVDEDNKKEEEEEQIKPEDLEVEEIDKDGDSKPDEDNDAGKHDEL